MSSRSPRSRLSLGVLLILLLSFGCMTVGPNYQAPTPETPDAWHTQAMAGLSEGQASLQTWWILLDDPKLNEVIQRAQENSLSVKSALWHLEEARALRGVVAGAQKPQLGLEGSSSRQQASDNGLAQAPSGGFDAVTLHDYGFSASWEIDLFGRIQRSVEAADAQLGATTEAYRDVLVSVLSEVSLAYVDLRATQERLRLARVNVSIQKETLQLTKDRFKAGLVSALDMAQAKSNLSNTEALIPILLNLQERDLNRLSVLLGRPPGELHEELLQPAPIPEEPEQITVGLPADLLRQRPDVRRAERELATQTAQVGVATAELYPSFSLSGFFGVQATGAGDLLSGSSRNWGIALPIRWSLFNGGRLRSQLRAEEARNEQALLHYRQTLLSALEDVENAMVAYEQEHLRREKLRSAVAATQRSLELVLTQYRAGLANFQNVLDTQRSLLLREDDLAKSEGLVIKDLIFLYRSLGGGWDPEEAAPNPEKGSEAVHHGQPQGEEQ